MRAAAESEAGQIDEIGKKNPYDKKLADLSREICSNGTIVKSTAPESAAPGRGGGTVGAEEASADEEPGFRRPTKVVAREENAGEKKIRESQLAAAEKNLDQLLSSLEAARKRVVEAWKADEAQVEFRRPPPKRQAARGRQRLRSSRPAREANTARSPEAEGPCDALEAKGSLSRIGKRPPAGDGDERVRQGRR